MKKTVFLVLLIATLLTAAPLRAEVPSWTFDNAHCSFFFEIKHIFYITRGFFEDYSGTFRFDPANLEESRFDITIRVKSINTNHRARDRHLRSDDFFDARKYPVMKFESTRIRHVQDDQYVADGKLTIKEVSRDISFPFVFWGERTDPFNAGVIVGGFESRLTIDRLDYGVGSGKYYDMGAIGKDVDLLISLEMRRPK